MFRIGKYLLSIFGLVVFICSTLTRAALEEVAARQLSELTEKYVSSLLLHETDTTSSALQRRIQTSNDFAAFNRLFQTAKIQLPDTKLVQQVVFNEFILDVSNLICYHVRIESMTVDYTTTTAAATTTTTTTLPELDLSLEMRVSLDCSMDYWYGFGSLEGRGSLEATTSNNLLKTTLSIRPGSSTTPPSISVNGCSATVGINELDFDGGVVAKVAEIMDDMIANVVETRVSSLVCDELSKLGSGMLTDGIVQLDKKMDPFLRVVPNDPLQVERTSTFGDKIVSMRAETGLGSLISTAVKQLNSWLTERVSDVDGPTGTGSDISINVMMRDQLLETKDLFLNVNVSDIANPVIIDSHDKVTETIMTIDAIKVYGLDTLKNFSGIDIIGNQTLHSTLHWDYLKVQIDMTVTMKASSRADSILKDANGDEVVEKIQVIVGVDELRVAVSLLVAMDEEKLGALELGSLLRSKNLLPCMLSVLEDFQVVGLDVSVSDIQDPVLNGFVSPGIDRVVSKLVEAAFAVYEPTFIQAIPGAFQMTVRNILNKKLIPDMLSNACSLPSDVDDKSQQIYVDFRDLLLDPNQAKLLGGSGMAQYGNLVRSGFDILKREVLAVDPVNGLSNVNDMLVAKLTESKSGEAGRIEFFEDIFDTTTRVNVGGLDAMVLLRLYDAFIDNLDSIGAPLALLEPVQGSSSELNNTATIGIVRPLQAGARFMFALTGEDMDVMNDIEISLSLHELSVVVTALMKVLETSFQSFPVRDVLNQYCWLSTMPAQPLDEHGARIEGTDPSLALTHLAASVSQFALNVTCNRCSSPGMMDLTELLSSPKTVESLTKSTNSLLDYLAQMLGGPFAQVTFDRLLAESRRRCPHNELYEENPVPVEYEAFTTPDEDGALALFLTLMLVLLVVGMVVVATVLVVRRVVKKRNREWLQVQPSAKIQRIWRQQCRLQRKEEGINATTTSLFRSSDIALWVRLFIPVCILGNIGLFLSGHLSLGATVSIVATIGEQTVEAANFFEFSLGQSIVEIWNAGGKALALLMLVFSGVWPYTKQLIAMVLWFVPPRSVSVSKRGSILLWLDILAKWSIVDIFVLVVTVVGFRVSVQSPDVLFLPDNFYSLDLLVVPMWGLYANMIAQLVSQISSHFIIHYHRKVIDAAEARMERPTLKSAETGLTLASDSDGGSTVGTSHLVDNYEVEQEEALYVHAFARPHRGESERLLVRR
jgi:hypothetical protein